LNFQLSSPYRTVTLWLFRLRPAVAVLVARLTKRLTAVACEADFLSRPSLKLVGILLTMACCPL
jgi:hypothetical protein